MTSITAKKKSAVCLTPPPPEGLKLYRDSFQTYLRWTVQGSPGDASIAAFALKVSRNPPREADLCEDNGSFNSVTAVGSGEHADADHLYECCCSVLSQLGRAESQAVLKVTGRGLVIHTGWVFLYLFTFVHVRLDRGGMRIRRILVMRRGGLYSCN